jgi:hypothetical protein
MKSCVQPLLLLLVVAIGTACRPKQSSAISEQELVRRTQSMMDAIVPGDKTPWQEYLAADVIYFDEKGRLHDKTSLLDDISPMPKGYSGSIKVVRPKSHIEGRIAILSYDMDETEAIFGQNLTARYHATDTWMNRNGRWQIVAGQVLRYYEDPAQGTADASRFSGYVGTYELAEGVTRTVTSKGKQLFTQRANRPQEELIPEDGDIFFRRGVEGRVLFHRDTHGKVVALLDRRNNEDVVWKKLPAR